MSVVTDASPLVKAAPIPAAGARILGHRPISVPTEDDGLDLIDLTGQKAERSVRERMAFPDVSGLFLHQDGVDDDPTGAWCAARPRFAPLVSVTVEHNHPQRTEGGRRG
jgi:hypothetical protein